MTRDELLKLEAEGWAELAGLFERIGDRWEEPGATDDWSPREVLAHIASWHEIAANWMLPSVIARDADLTGPWWWGDLDGYNEMLRARAKPIPLGVVRRASERARSIFLDVVNELPDEVHDVPKRVVIGNGSGHYEEHIAPLRAFVERA
jgi:hypothetical protein